MSSFQQIVFLHILKTAGQSVMQVLESNYKEEDRLFANKDELLKLSPGLLNKYKIIYGHNFYNIHQLLGRKPLYFTFLRDPIERTLSHYAYLRRAKYLPKVLSQTVEEFVSAPETRPYVANYQTRWLASESLGEPAGLDNDIVLGLAKKRLEEFAFVGIVEEFRLSLKTMARVFGWKLPWTTPKVNVVTTGRLKRDELSEDALKIIRDANLLDFELYEYGQELFKSQSNTMN